MTPDEEKRSRSDAYWRAREAADAGRDEPPDVISGGDVGGDEPQPERRMIGPIEPPPHPADEPAWDDYSPSSPASPVQTSAPAPDAKSKRLAVLQEASRLAASPVDTGIGDSDIAAAQSRDRTQRGKDAFTEALQAWLQRRPQRMQEPTEGSDLLQRRQLAEGSALKQRGQQLSVQEQIAKALTEPKPDAGATMTAYQKAELDMRGKELQRKGDERSQALADRKRTMLALYPDHKAEIDAVTDLGDAQTLQTALEGRLGRAETQTHSDRAAEEGSRRAFQNALALKEWERNHQNLTAEQKSQLEGIEKSDAAIDTFEGGMGSTSSFVGKLGASAPKIAGAAGVPGADFQSLREGTAIALARGLEGGMARPGNVEIIQHMLPEASDSDAVKRQKLAHVRDFVKNNREAFTSAAEQTGAVMKPPAAKPPRAVRIRRRDNGETDEFSPEDAAVLLKNSNFERVP